MDPARVMSRALRMARCAMWSPVPLGWLRAFTLPDGLGSPSSMRPRPEQENSPSRGAVLGWTRYREGGLRHSLPETVDAAIVQGLARCGMSWLCLGATVSHGNIVRLTEVGVTLGLGHAVEVGAGALQWLETGAAARVTVEGLLTAVVSVAVSCGMLPQQPPATAQESLLALGRHVTEVG